VLVSRRQRYCSPDARSGTMAGAGTARHVGKHVGRPPPPPHRDALSRAL